MKRGWKGIAKSERGRILPSLRLLDEKRMESLSSVTKYITFLIFFLLDEKRMERRIPYPTSAITTNLLLDEKRMERKRVGFFMAISLAAR